MLWNKPIGADVLFLFNQSQAKPNMKITIRYLVSCVFPRLTRPKATYCNNKFQKWYNFNKLKRVGKSNIMQQCLNVKMSSYLALYTISFKCNFHISDHVKFTRENSSFAGRSNLILSARYLCYNRQKSSRAWRHNEENGLLLWFRILDAEMKTALTLSFCCAAMCNKNQSLVNCTTFPALNPWLTS